MISYMNSRNGHPQLSSSHHVGPNFHRVWVVVGGGYTDIGLATKSGYNVGGGIAGVQSVRTSHVHPFTSISSSSPDAGCSPRHRRPPAVFPHWPVA